MRHQNTYYGRRGTLRGYHMALKFCNTFRRHCANRPRSEIYKEALYIIVSETATRLNFGNFQKVGDIHLGQNIYLSGNFLAFFGKISTSATTVTITRMLPLATLWLKKKREAITRFLNQSPSDLVHQNILYHNETLKIFIYNTNEEKKNLEKQIQTNPHTLSPFGAFQLQRTKTKNKIFFSIWLHSSLITVR